MKILIDGSVFQIPATGIAKATLNLYENCIDLDPSLEVVIVHRRQLKCTIPPKINTVKFCGFLPEFLWRSIALPFYINIKKPDIVHFPWNGKIPGFIRNTKIITTIFDLIPLRVPEFFKNNREEEIFRKKLQKSIDRADTVITSSIFSKKDIIKDFKLKNQPFVLYIGPTIKCSNINDESKNDYFLYVGGYDKRKGIEFLIKAFKKLLEETKIKSKVVSTGDKIYYSENLKELIEEGKEKGFLVEKGYVGESELCNLYANAIALVYPSIYEGFGLPPLEAMMLGCPVITTKSTSIPEVCGSAAYYIDINKKTELYEAIINLEYDRELRDKLKLMGKEQSSKFSWKSISKSFLEKINNI